MEGIATLLGFGFLVSLALMLVVPAMVICFFMLVHRACVIAASTTRLERIVRTHFEQEIK